MKRSKLAKLLSIVLVAAFFAGCGKTGDGKTSESNAPATTQSAKSTDQTNKTPESPSATGMEISEPGVFPIVSEPVSMKVVVRDVPYVGDVNTNAFTKWYEEKTNVKMEYIEIPAESLAEKVNLLLAGNELPDIFMDSAQDVPLYGSKGVYLSLNDYIDNHGVEIKNVFDEHTNLPSSIQAVDGNIYALPNINSCFHCRHNLKGWINQQWLDNLGLEYPNTTEEFEAVLTAFKEKDPNGNGKADEVPAMGQKNNPIYPFLLNSFTYFVPNEYTYLDDNGTITFVPNTEEVREGLKWIKGLVDKGLLDPTSLTQAPEQLKQVGTDPSAVTVGVFQSAVWWDGVGMDKDTPDKRSRQYVGLSPLEGPSGVRYSPYIGNDAVKDSFVITNVCEYPEIAFKWADGLYSYESTLKSQIGIEGTHWKQPSAGVTGINGKPALFEQISLTDAELTEANGSVVNIFIGNRSSDFRLGQMADYSNPETQWEIEPRLYNTTVDYFMPYAHDEKAVPPLAYSEQEEVDRAIYRTQINDYVTESIVLFLTGNKDLDKDWDSYVKEYDSLGLDKLLEIMQTAYDRQYK